MTLGRVVQTLTWKWLFEVYRALGATIEIIDDRLTSIVSSSLPGSGPTTVLELTNEARRAITRALNEGPSSIVTISERRFSCTPITSANRVVGGVLVGSTGPKVLGDLELTRAGALLTRALEDHLVDAPSEHRVDSRRVAALHQLLHAASAHGFEPEVIGIFAEALSVWEEIEVLGYRADLNGCFRLETALPGSDRALVPHVLSSDSLPSDLTVLRLTRSDREELGFRGSGETTLAKLATEGGPWLLAMNAAADPRASEWFDLYVAALAISLNTALAIEASRLTWGIMQHFVEAASPDRGANPAVQAVAQALRAEGRFTAWASEGTVVVSAGVPIAFSQDPATLRTADVLRSRLDTGAPSQAIIEMRAKEGRPFSQREAKLFDAAVATFNVWFATAGRQLGATRERRTTPRSFDQTIDRYVREGAGARDAALILISPSTTGATPDLTYGWIKRVRPQLRPTDLAGRLTSGEVAVLALETPAAGALVVAQRLAQILTAPIDNTDAQAQAEPAFRVGFAANAGESLSGPVLIERARSQIVTTTAEKG